MIPFELQKAVNNFRIDLYLPDQRLAIEIDEFNHKDRDDHYEKERERIIIECLNCCFIRIDPDNKDFKLSTCLGQITRETIKN